jgi:membrane protein
VTPDGEPGRIGWLRHYAVGLYDRVDEHHVFLFAGGLAFSVVVCIVPLVLILFSILGHVLDVADLDARLGDAVDTFIPYASQADFVKGLLIGRAHEIISHRGVAGLVGTLGLLFAASGLFSSMRTILNTIFHTDKQKSELVAKGRDFVMVIAVLCIFLLSVLAAPILEAFVELAQSTGALGQFALSALQEYVLSYLSLIIIFGAFFSLYYFVTYESLRPRVALVSAACATGLWELATQVFGFYISEFGTMRRVYGTYALAVIAVFWIYYAAVLFILAAEVGQLYRERLDLREHAS